jgi:hypothetical protein
MFLFQLVHQFSATPMILMMNPIERPMDKRDMSRLAEIYKSDTLY